MHDRRRAGLRQVLGEPRVDVVDRRDLARARCAPTGRRSAAAGARGSRSACRSPPGPHARQSTAWISTSASISSSPIRAPAGASSPAGSAVVITSPLDALHHVERRADHGLVVADGEHARDAHRRCPRAPRSRRASRSTSCARRRQRRRAAGGAAPIAAVAADRGRSRWSGRRRPARPRARRCRARARRGTPPAGDARAAAGGSSAAASSGVSTIAVKSGCDGMPET